MLRYCALTLLLVPMTGFAGSAPRLPVLPAPGAWKLLPGAAEVPQPLPTWARQLAGMMPITTARMLELDAMHRSGDRLDARLRSLVRWAAADANGCEYSKAVAAADLRRARNADLDIAGLLAKSSELPALDRAAVKFARKMMREAHSVTDAEVKQLIELGGEERTMALVALLAHASFQDRMILALNSPPEPKEGIPPLVGRFPRPTAKPGGSPPKSPPKPETPPAASVTPDWVALQQELDAQRQRPGRIRVPSREEVISRLGEKHPAAWQAGITWSRVAYGYQPELTDAWFECVAARRQESSINTVFGNSIFWVVTQSLKCFY